MNALETINANDFVPEDYSIRNVVRCVIWDEATNKVVFFGKHLPGGGVEEGESDAEAIARECMEEVGMKVEVVRALGEIVMYRDFLKKKYVVHGYLCKQIGEAQKPTTTDPTEIEVPIKWMTVPSAISALEEKITSLIEQFQSGDADVTQRKIYNRKVSLRFLKELAVSQG